MPQGWSNFYFMLGGAAATLIGLLFVVSSLSRSGDVEKAERGQRYFLTPTLFNFGAVLAMSAVGLMPGLSCRAYQLLAGAVALCGLVRGAHHSMVMLRANPFPGAHWSDGPCYAFGPAALYAALCVALAVLDGRSGALFDAVGLILAALLLLSVRNAWDLVTFLAARRGA